MSLRSSARLALLLALLGEAASAQGLAELALGWPAGDFRSPLVCIVEGQPRQALRRVRIQPSATTARPTARVAFQELDAPPGTTCTGVTGEPELELAGSLDLVFEGRTRPDTGGLDFKNALRRDGGFRYRVASGSLRAGPPGGPADAREALELEGAEAWIRTVPAGSDAARRLASFGGRRQLQLELLLPGRSALRFDLVDRPGR